MKIGLLNIDKTKFPNIALGKISRYYKELGHLVEWYNPLCHYDIAFVSKIFTFSQDYPYFINADKVYKGGTGYDLHTNLPDEIDRIQPDYSIYSQVDKRTAYGFLTRGCPNKCPWCVVPIKEGKIRPYMDVEEIAIEGRNKLVLMDNNIVACDYGLQQIEKIVKLGLHVDFNQAIDARIITEDIAKLLAKVKWIGAIRLGCDTQKKIVECERAMKIIDKYHGDNLHYLLYTMIYNGIDECYNRLSHFRNNKYVRIVAQPYRDFNNHRQVIPQWQRDMARWSMRRELYAVCDFKDYIPRKGFCCREYFTNKDLIK